MNSKQCSISVQFFFFFFFWVKILIFFQPQSSIWKVHFHQRCSMRGIFVCLPTQQSVAASKKKKLLQESGRVSWLSWRMIVSKPWGRYLTSFFFFASSVLPIFNSKRQSAPPAVAAHHQECLPFVNVAPCTVLMKSRLWDIDGHTQYTDEWMRWRLNENSMDICQLSHLFQVDYHNRIVMLSVVSHQPDCFLFIFV